MKYIKTFENLEAPIPKFIMITIFENFNNPDLRKMSKFVRCIKPIKSFNSGNFYKVDGMKGDPERAINEFGLNDYLPVECISNIFLIGASTKNIYSKK